LLCRALLRESVDIDSRQARILADFVANNLIALLAGLLFYASEVVFGKRNWFANPVISLTDYIQISLWSSLREGSILTGPDPEQVLKVDFQQHEIRSKREPSHLINLAELRMKMSSEATCIPAASRGFRRPRNARATPIPSTINVPMKFTIMVRYAFLLSLATSAIF
jgi:hypothetical protein